MNFVLICLTVNLAIIECQPMRSNFQIENNCDLNSTNSLSKLIKSVTVREKLDCLMECNKIDNCKSVSFSSLDCTCRLYAKSQQEAGQVKISSIGRNLHFKIS